MKSILSIILFLVLAVSWTVPATAAQARSTEAGKGLPAPASTNLAPDSVPAFPAPAPVAGMDARPGGNGAPPENVYVREKVREFLDEAIPLLPSFLAERERFWGSPPTGSFSTGMADNGSAWNELYLRSIRLSLSTIPGEDDHLKRLVPGATPEGERWEQFRNLPERLRSGSYRDTIEGLGVIIEPRIRLGVEF